MRVANMINPHSPRKQAPRFPTAVTVLSLLLLVPCVAAVDVEKCLMYALASEILRVLELHMFSY